MKINTQMKQPNVVPSPINTDGAATVPGDTSPLMQEQGIQYAELWKVIRGVLVVWAVAVWLLLVMMPGVQQISNAATAMLHLPHMFMGLGLIGAIFASYSLRSDIHLLWFLGVLLLLAGWM
ncbi:MAG: hypothetical protein ACPGSM_03805 [Thiolinea sp.]